MSAATKTLGAAMLGRGGRKVTLTATEARRIMDALVASELTAIVNAELLDALTGALSVLYGHTKSVPQSGVCDCDICQSREAIAALLEKHQIREEQQ